MKDENKLAESEKLLGQAMAMRRATRPLESESLSNTLTNLAYVLFLEGKNVESEQLYREALGIQRKLWVPPNLTLSITMNDFAQLLVKERKFVEAESLFRETLKIRSKYAPNTPATKATAQKLMDLLEQTGRTREAAVLRKQFALSGASSQPVQRQ